MSVERDRVRRHTARAVLRQIDETTASRLEEYADADPEVIGQRLAKLDREWDTDRVIEIESAFMGIVGLALGAWVRPALLTLPVFVGGAVLLHAFTGRYPLLPLLRRLGVRSPREIARERYALKSLRGDFSGMDLADTPRDEPAAAPAPSLSGNSHPDGSVRP